MVIINSCIICNKKPKRRFSNGKLNSYCIDCGKKKLGEWYEKNREYKVNKTQNLQKINNYSYEKTEKQRKLRYTKRRTRLLYPLTDEKCTFCNLEATEHHHNTNPIQVDKFLFVCHDCYGNQDIIRRSKTQ